MPLEFCVCKFLLLAQKSSAKHGIRSGRNAARNWKDHYQSKEAQYRRREYFSRFCIAYPLRGAAVLYFLSCCVGSMSVKQNRHFFLNQVRSRIFVKENND